MSQSSLAPSDFSIDKDGWLSTARHLPSPNCDDRCSKDPISLLVIHNISLPPGQFGSGHVDAFFCNQLDISAHEFYQEIKDLRVSAHFFVTREGAVTQFVATTQRAWHAGVSHFDGRSACNDFSIGIEMEGTDDLPYTDDQYHTLTRLTEALMNRHPAITRDRIAGHCDIAPERKTDPGPAFDWHRYRASLHSS
ncbi:MAG: 1,6-anhydro-N-acetylmuramyl-L-alanine amidase AmpD [Cellvibrionaceae bacterium]